LNKYAGSYEKYFDKYTNNNGGGNHEQYQGASPTELIEKSPVTESGSLDTLNLAAKADSSTGSQGNYKQYMDKYAGSYEQYMKKYAGKYQKYQNYQNDKACADKDATKITSAKDAQNQQELQEWMQGALQKVKCFVPDEYASYSTKDIDRQYKRRLAELNGAGEDTLSTKDTESSSSPFMTQDAVELIEKPTMAEKTQTASKTFLAKSTAAAETKVEELAKEAKHKAEIAQSQAEANLTLFADQVKSDPLTVVGASSLGAALACFVFFAVRHRRNVQIPVAQLG